MMRSFLFTLLLCPLAAFGCSARSSGQEIPPLGVDGGLSLPPPEEPAQKPKLVVDPPRAGTPYDSVSIRGSGPGGGKIVANTATKSVVRDIDDDGHFCIDVPLAEGIENTIWLKASNEDGIFSDEVEVSVTQEGDPPDGTNESGEGTILRNIAKNGTLEVDFDIKDGDKAAINDGDPETMVELDEDNGNKGSVVIALTERAPLHSVRIRSAEDCRIKEYKLYVIDSVKPPDPPDGWLQIADVTDDGGTGDDIHPAPVEGLNVTHVALFPTKGCGGSTFLFDENYKVKEVEVRTTAPKEGMQPQGGPKCADGGGS